ncbi:MAG: DUF3795 domain-containing protein [bacterium]
MPGCRGSDVKKPVTRVKCRIKNCAIFQSDKPGSCFECEGFPCDRRFPCYNAGHKMGAEAGDQVVLVNPSEMVEIMKTVPKGKLITLVEICKIIAKKHKVGACCSLTTGIFIITCRKCSRRGSKGREKSWYPLLADIEGRRISQ